MTDLNALLAETTRPTVVAELSQLAESTIASQSGLTGMALKTGVAAVKKSNADAIPWGIERFLPELVSALTPYWEAYDPASSAGFGNYLASRGDDVVASLLEVGDRAAESGPASAGRVYTSLRGKAVKILAPVLPELGDIIERHAR